MSAPVSPRARASLFAQYAGLAAKQANIGKPVGSKIGAVRPSLAMTGVSNAWNAIDSDPRLNAMLRACAVARASNPNAICDIKEGDVTQAVARWIASDTGKQAIAKQTAGRINRQRLKRASFGSWPEGPSNAAECTQGNLRPSGEFKDYCYHTRGSVGGRSAWSKLKTAEACRTGLSTVTGGPLYPGTWNDLKNNKFSCAAPAGYGKAAIQRNRRGLDRASSLVSPSAAIPARVLFSTPAAPVRVPTAARILPPSASSDELDIGEDGLDDYGRQYYDDMAGQDYNDMAGQDYNDMAGQYYNDMAGQY